MGELERVFDKVDQDLLKSSFIPEKKWQLSRADLSSHSLTSGPGLLLRAPCLDQELRTLVAFIRA